MRLRRFVGELERIPQGYGYAWSEWDRLGSVCYPLPLNILMGFLHRAWLWMVRRGVETDPIWKAYSSGYSEGFSAGAQHRESSDAMYAAGFDKFKHLIER